MAKVVLTANPWNFLSEVTVLVLVLVIIAVLVLVLVWLYPDA